MSLFFYIVSVSNNALLPAWHKVHDAFLEEIHGLVNPCLDAALNVIHASIVISAQRLFKLAKQVIVRRCQVRAIWRMWEDSPAKLVDSFLCSQSCIRSGIIVAFQAFLG